MNPRGWDWDIFKGRYQAFPDGRHASCNLSGAPLLLPQGPCKESQANLIPSQEVSRATQDVWIDCLIGPWSLGHLGDLRRIIGKDKQ